MSWFRRTLAPPVLDRNDPYAETHHRLQALYPNDQVSFAIRLGSSADQPWLYCSARPMTKADWPPGPGKHFVVQLREPNGERQELLTKYQDTLHMPTRDESGRACRTMVVLTNL